ncbi:unnamed protein product [Spirodela intermedia]|uniref:Uncharacterized protein n=1 Tax=Spirodela intermedia TaxID=51605 RepID=A0A7I8IUL6_SPIIN|nr:unnamed protein product [Spirodela intermedia]CAA6661577.1 unnamed protein product [Spirodela intermedia]
MGFSRVFLVCLIFSLLAALTVHSHPTTAVEKEKEGSILVTMADWFGGFEDCARACAGRCRLSSRPNLCKRACGTCCSRCNCVPPGTAETGRSVRAMPG